MEGHKKTSCPWQKDIDNNVIEDNANGSDDGDIHNGAALPLSPSSSSSSFLSPSASCLRHFHPAAGLLRPPSQVGASKITVAIVQLSTIVAVLVLEGPLLDSPPASVIHLSSIVAGVSSVASVSSINRFPPLFYTFMLIASSTIAGLASCSVPPTSATPLGSALLYFMLLGIDDTPRPGQPGPAPRPAGGVGCPWIYWRLGKQNTTLK
ncbi:uncharacterized protein DS421_1g27810 [Arachis hypogaea]|nr:uncharacterized protein DS421_1g27810 [Arachis hypogaea]